VSTLNVRTLSLADPSLFAVIADRLGGQASDFVIGTRLGPPRANRKPVLAIADRAGRLVAFAKYGVDPLTDRLITREALALGELKALNDGNELTTLVAPELIATGEHEGHPFIVQSPVPTRHRQPTAAAVADAQVEVARLGIQSVNGANALATLRSQWHERNRTGGPAREAFSEVAEAWCEVIEAQEVEWGTWHGDWRTTNMSSAPIGCSVWDWERFTRGVPLGYDALHLFLTTRQSSVRDLTTLPDDVRENAPRLLRPFGITRRDISDLVTTGYLLELAGRYLDDEQEQAGARLGAVAEWLLPHVRDAVSAWRANRGVS
jgi:hypothetical protein